MATSLALTRLGPGNMKKALSQDDAWMGTGRRAESGTGLTQWVLAGEPGREWQGTSFFVRAGSLS